MKVVLFCGGQGMRLRDYAEKVPKPMVPVGYRPILWHVMKYYALHGHNEFILCLGYGADRIKDFFLNYEEAVSNDFVLRGGTEKTMLNTDIDEWTITFVDTGLRAEIGERLARVESYLDGEEMFLANYADGVTDLDLASYIDDFKRSGKAGGLLAVRPPQSYHVVTVDDGGQPSSMGPIEGSDLWVNAGYFVFGPTIFDYLGRHKDLAAGVLPEMIRKNDLYAHRYQGFWSPMDTFKDKNRLDAIWESGNVPWLLNRNGTL